MMPPLLRILPLLAFAWLPPLVDCGPAETLNDVHSRLNPVEVAEVARPVTPGEVSAAVLRAKREGKVVSIAGRRHSMGGQQFAAGALHLDMTELNRFLSLDRGHGRARVEAGITWPALRAALESAQAEDETPWVITQKQTGADELTLGGAVSSNIHGRGLNWQPIVQDVESVTVIDATGAARKLSRTENAELFSLAVGGYGLFGVITEVELRLSRRTRVERVVEVTPLADLVSRMNRRITDGFTMGDFQFCPDENSAGFLNEGVFSCYRPVPAAEAATASAGDAEKPLSLAPEAWKNLLILAHRDKAKAWQTYTTYYQKTTGQRYWSDLSQFNHYDPGYAEFVHAALPDLPRGSLMISEVYVPRDRLEDFMAAAAADFRAGGVNVIYGTIRFIRADTVTFLPWARKDFACIVVNLRVTHTEAGMEKAKAGFRRLIDLALDRGGSFYLTYHRWATKEQVLKAYPEFPAFLARKKLHDPEERFQSEWYRHWKTVMAE